MWRDMGQVFRTFLPLFDGLTVQREREGCTVWQRPIGMLQSYGMRPNHLAPGHPQKLIWYPCNGCISLPSCLLFLLLTPLLLAVLQFVLVVTCFAFHLSTQKYLMLQDTFLKLEQSGTHQCKLIIWTRADYSRPSFDSVFQNIIMFYTVWLCDVQMGDKVMSGET